MQSPECSGLQWLIEARKPTAQDAADDKADRQVMVQGPCGLGRVVLVAFDLDTPPFTGWAGHTYAFYAQAFGTDGLTTGGPINAQATTTRARILSSGRMGRSTRFRMGSCSPSFPSLQPRVSR